MAKMNRFFVDLHILQTVPPSCVNRDDSGSPKNARYGGTTRARVSSQSWKHAMRKYFMQESSFETGVRTKLIVDLVRDEILALDPDRKPEEAQEMAKKALEYAGVEVKDPDKGSDVLFFMSRKQAKSLAELSVQGVAVQDDKKKKQSKGDKISNPYNAALRKDPAFDMVLFGRMVAMKKDKKELPSLNYDAAAQVAHAISTHTVHNEFDFFTADDDATEDNAGAHLGTVEYNSATLYRYATVNVCELAANIGADDTAGIVRAFAEAFCKSMPTGKQNTFANRTMPDLVYVTVRRDQPVNLVGAFEDPVREEGHGYLKKSEDALIRHAQNIYNKFASAPALALGCCINDELGKIAELMPLDELLDKLEQYVAENLPAGGQA